MTQDDASEDEPSEESRDESDDAAYGEPGWQPNSGRPYTYTEEDRRAREFDRTDRETLLERWEVVGRNALCPLLDHHRDAVVLEIEDTGTAVEAGCSPDSMHVDRLRQAVADLETTVEECIARLAEGTRPWEHSARRIPDWRLREELGLEPAGEGEPTGSADGGGAGDEPNGVEEIAEAANGDPERLRRTAERVLKDDDDDDH